jgi:ketosteroid isomerase-like protein
MAHCRSTGVIPVNSLHYGFGKATDGEGAVTDRSEIHRLLRELYAARVSSDLDALCRAFSEEATFKIAGISGHDSAIAVTAMGIGDIRQWLSLLIKTFEITDQVILSIVVENDKAAVHWRARIYSRITGIVSFREVVDLVELRNGHVVCYTEFLVPCR